MVILMTLILDDNLLKQMRVINLEHSDKVKFSVLIGTVDLEKKEVSILSAIHFPVFETESKSKFVFNESELNQIKALQYMLPFNLGVLGLCYYFDEEITQFTLEDLTNKFSKISSLQFLMKVGKVENEYYQLLKTNPVKINAQVRDFVQPNLLSFIHTIEFETNEKAVEEQLKLKEVLFDGIDFLWDKVTYNKDPTDNLMKLQSNKSPIDRIIEITIPSINKNLTSKTEAGMVFLAIDLHINFFVKDSLRYMKLDEMGTILNKAMKQDLMIKLQRSTYDYAIKRLKVPEKIPLKFFGIELNGYLSSENPSKFEFELCGKLSFHAEIMSLLGNDVQSRIFLRDLLEYYKKLKDKEKYLEINNLISKLGSKN